MHGETVIKQYGNETYHQDEYGNKVEKLCIVCSGQVGILLGGNKTIINGQCLECHKVIEPVEVRRYTSLL